LPKYRKPINRHFSPLRTRCTFIRKCHVSNSDKTPSPLSHAREVQLGGGQDGNNCSQSPLSHASEVQLWRKRQHCQSRQVPALTRARGATGTNWSHSTRHRSPLSHAREVQQQVSPILEKPIQVPALTRARGATGEKWQSCRISPGPRSHTRARCTTRRLPPGGATMSPLSHAREVHPVARPCLVVFQSHVPALTRARGAPWPPGGSRLNPKSPLSHAREVHRQGVETQKGVVRGAAPGDEGREGTWRWSWKEAF
jgi:hypothetical protein